MKRSSAGMLGAAIVLGTLSGVGCESMPPSTVRLENGMPLHDAGRDRAHYQVTYHPDVQAYYTPYNAQFFWFQEGDWRTGPRLPATLHPDPARARIVRVGSSVPPLHHATVLSLNDCPGTMPSRFDPRRNGGMLVTLAAAE